MSISLHRKKNRRQDGRQDFQIKVDENVNIENWSTYNIDVFLQFIKHKQSRKYEIK